MLGYTADTVYFGGGTPSLLSARQLSSILGTLAGAVSIATDAEITLECNPATVDETALRTIGAAGVNRLSIGAQSLDNAELAALGRIHNASAVGETVVAARRAGFNNLSIDLMYGIPGQTLHSFETTVAGVLEMCPEHISTYGLKVEPGTPFGKMGSRLVLPGEDDVADMYLDVCSMLEDAGLRQYEISNFARPGYESRHNLKYWHCADYIGFGVAASSCFEGVRFTAPRDMGRYMICDDPAERFELTAADRETEYVMLALRMTDGVRYADYAAHFGASAADKYGPRIEKYVRGGFVRCDPRGFALTRQGMLVSNSILSDILDL